MRKYFGGRINAEKIIRLLSGIYGRPPALKRSRPLDELIRTILSQNTSDNNSLKAFGVLKRSFRTWEGLLRADVRRIARLIGHAGLANIKSKRIKDALLEIKAREGSLSLAALKDMSVKEAGDYLRSLKGVGPKTAACVLLFSFNKPAMPVDTHIFRVAKRLGLIDDDLDIEEAHKVLTALVPRNLIYEFHLGIIEHGRRTCKAENPRCGTCVLYDMCAFRLKTKFKERGLN